MSSPGRFAGTSVLVTGSSRGLGRDIAVAFGAEGAFTAIGYHVHEEEAGETLALIRQDGGDGAVHRMDVRSRDAVQETVASIEQRFPVSVLVNNAGIVQDRPFLMLSPKEWTDTMDTNLTGTYNCCRAVLPGMLARGRGSIVNIASVAATRASPGQASYAASKGAILSLTRTLAAELAPRGVRVNAVIPGLLDTGMGARLDRRVADGMRTRIPLKRLGRGEEVARLVLFLASDEASYVVGQAVTVDGGLSL